MPLPHDSTLPTATAAADPPQPRPQGAAAQWTLILAFLAIIASVPLYQTAHEIRQRRLPRALDVFKARPTAAHLRAFEENLEKASVFESQVRPWLQFAQFAWLTDGGEKALIGLDDWLFYKPGVDAMLQAPRTGAGEARDPLPAILTFRDDLVAHGIHLLVVIAPNKESVYPDKLVRRAADWRQVRSPGTVDLLHRMRAAGVSTVDLFHVYSQARRSEAAPGNSPLYLVQDSHWSPAGLRLAAKAVAERLRNLGWVEPGTADYSSRPVVVSRTGDVLRMLRVGLLERRTPPESIPCEQVVDRATGRTYEDDPGSGILLLGDSFLRIFQHDEPGAAGFIAHLAGELRQPVSSWVNDGGASTLVRQELHRRPALLRGKRVVIWEFVERDIPLGAEGWQIIPLRDKLAAMAGE